MCEIGFCESCFFHILLNNTFYGHAFVKHFKISCRIDKVKLFTKSVNYFVNN